MASNVELVASIAALDESAVTDGLNNAQLTSLLKELRAADEEAAAKAKADEESAAKAKADEEAAAKAKADEEAAAKAKVLRVAPGKSITSKRGIIGPGEEVHETDVNDLQALKKRGIVA